MGSDAAYVAVIEDYYPVGILDTGYSLGDYELGHAGDLRPEGLTDLGIGRGIYGTGRIVENKDLGILEKRPCDAQTLLLTAGYIG